MKSKKCPPNRTNHHPSNIEFPLPTYPARLKCTPSRPIEINQQQPWARALFSHHLHQDRNISQKKHARAHLFPEQEAASRTREEISLHLLADEIMTIAAQQNKKKNPPCPRAHGALYILGIYPARKIRKGLCAACRGVQEDIYIYRKEEKMEKRGRSRTEWRDARELFLRPFRVCVRGVAGTLDGFSRATRRSHPRY